MDKIKKDILFKRDLVEVYRRYDVLPDRFSGTIIENWHGGEISNISKTRVESLPLIEEVKRTK